MAGTSKNPNSNSGKSNGAPGAALVYVKCGYTVCQFSHDSEVTPPRPPESHLNEESAYKRGGTGTGNFLF